MSLGFLEVGKIGIHEKFIGLGPKPFPIANLTGSNQCQKLADTYLNTQIRQDLQSHPLFLGVTAPPSWFCIMALGFALSSKI